MMRRGFRRGRMRQAMRPDVPPMLQRAHGLMASGDYPAAAEAFEGLARAGMGIGAAASASATTRKPILPTHCPGCGGPVRAEN